MSVDKMSAAVRTQIVSRIEQAILRRSGTITERTIKSFAEYTSRIQIRADTDTVGGRHESVVSRGAFSSLISDMTRAIEKDSLSKELTNVVQTISFDGFVQYISDIYYGENTNVLTEGNSRTRGNFTYTGVSRQTKDNAAVYAKATDRKDADRDVLILKNIPQRKLVLYFIDYIEANTTGMSPETKASLNKSLQGGHLTGVFTARLVRAFGINKLTDRSVVFRDNKNTANPSELEKQLTNIVSLVTDADYLSSNLILDLDLFLNTDKRLYANAAEVKLTTEIQFADENKAAGDLLTAAGASLSKLIGSVKYGASSTAQEVAAQKAFKDLLLKLQGVSKYIKDRVRSVKELGKVKALDPKVSEELERILASSKTFDTLINTEGSPTLLNHISYLVANAIDLNQKVKAKPSVSIAKVKSNVIKKSTSPKKVLTRPPQAKLTKISISTNTSRKRNTISPIISLEAILRAGINEQVAKNMGKGSETRILNYRTGRFSESVNIERLSESRQGMISVFYSYMKNPYATFSEGGRQQYPKTRDPKLLISKSIRELAGPTMANRLRSVVV